MTIINTISSRTSCIFFYFLVTVAAMGKRGLFIMTLLRIVFRRQFIVTCKYEMNSNRSSDYLADFASTTAVPARFFFFGGIIRSGGRLFFVLANSFPLSAPTKENKPNRFAYRKFYNDRGSTSTVYYCHYCCRH